jgi:hypothetical protein
MTTPWPWVGFTREWLVLAKVVDTVAFHHDRIGLPGPEFLCVP